MALGTLRLVMANHGAVTIELPTSHGSIRMLYAPLADFRSDGRGCGSGEKIRRNVASAFRCRTVTDIAGAYRFIMGVLSQLWAANRVLSRAIDAT